MFDPFFRLTDNFGYKCAAAQYALIPFSPFTYFSHCLYHRSAAYEAIHQGFGAGR
jgi:hypothetical protein